MHSRFSSIHPIALSFVGVQVSVMVLVTCTPSPRYVSTRGYAAEDAVSTGQTAASEAPSSSPAAFDPDSAEATDTAAPAREGDGVPAVFQTDDPGASVPPSSWEAAFDEPPPRKQTDTAAEWSQRGIASWYGAGFERRKTASGERFDSRKFTAAHKTLPFNTVVKVTNIDNGLSVEVRINDRGPFDKNRIIDLSKAAARTIELDKSGIANVAIEVVREAAQ